MPMLKRTRRLIIASIMAVFIATLTVVGVTSQPAQAAVGCAGGVEPAELFVTHDANGVPTGRYAYAYAWNNCTANEPIVLDLCIKYQVYTGSAWYNYTTWKCTSNSGPNIAVNRLNNCSDIGSALIRSVAKATVRGIASGFSQTVTYREVGTRPCA